MAKYVICKYCGQKFDREKEQFVLVGTKRYAHAACANREDVLAVEGPPKKVLTDFEYVTCRYCRKPFDKEVTEHVRLENGRYAHKTCADAEATRTRTDQEVLEDYIMELYQVDFVPPTIRLQIKRFINEYNFTYSGIRRSLEYWYDIKKNPVNPKYKDTIAIVPSIYNKAYQYFYSIWEAQQKNAFLIQNKEAIEKYKPKEVVIKIPVPKRKPKKKRGFFDFLDKEEG